MRSIAVGVLGCEALKGSTRRMYCFIDGGCADGVDEVDGELNHEDYDEKGRHGDETSLDVVQVAEDCSRAVLWLRCICASHF